MNKFILDDETSRKLKVIPTRSALCDGTGKVLGFFVSPESYVMMIEAQEKFRAIDRAEMEEISKEKGGRPLKAILSDLEK